MRKITSTELKTLIEENSAEAVHVDFKQEWYANNAKLVHRILCISNADYDGDRFLLIGVNDNAEIIGVSADKNRKNNSTLFDLLRNSNFNRLPDIDIYTLQVDSHSVDVIHIANTSYKPYFLLKDKNEDKFGIRANIIYSRNGSSNTPIDSSASETEIEKMWRERFGIDKSPATRVKQYLLDFSNWVSEDYIEFYEPFPEFTIHQDYEEGKSLPWDYEWNRGEIGYDYTSGNCASQIGIFYHQTCLYKIHIVIFDGGKKCIVVPKWKAVGAGRFYYYLEDSVDYAYQKRMTHNYMIHTREKDFSKDLQFASDSGKTGKYDIPVLKNKDELEQFMSHLKQSSSELPTRDKSEQNKLWYAVLEEYNNWKNRELTC